MSGGISAFSPPHAVKIDRAEALRYMRAGNAPDEAFLKTVDEVKKLVTDAARCRACYVYTDVEIDGDAVTLGNVTVRSASLAKCLSDCGRAYIFAATVGTGVDRLISRLGVTSPARALIADALGSAAIESFCDELNEFLAAGKRARPRFSPGYGDLPLAFQNDLIRLLNAPANIGLALTDSLLMTPVKSVTAIIGIENDPRKEPQR